MNQKLNINYLSLLKHITLAAIFILILFANNSIYSSGINSSNLVRLSNSSRQAAGLNILVVSPALEYAAAAKIEDMFDAQYFDHISPIGIVAWDFMLTAGYDYSFAGENLALNFNSAEGMHRAWMESATHRQNILNPNYREIGIATKSALFNGQEATLTVQMFGASRSEVLGVYSYRLAELVKNMLGIK